MQEKEKRSYPRKGFLRELRQDLSVFRNLRALCFAAMLAAMGVVLGIFAKMIFGEGPLRITFENLPVIFGGITFGPFMGMAIALVADLGSCVYAGQAPYPLIAVGSLCIGFFSGAVGKYLLRRRSYPYLLLVELTAHTVGSILLKSLALYTFGYGWPLLLPRIPVYLLISALEALLLRALFGSDQLTRLMKTFYSVKKEKEL